MDYNMRALEKEKKEFVTVSNIFYVTAILITFMSLLLAVDHFITAMTLLNKSGDKTALYSSINAAMDNLVFAWVFRFVWVLFSRLKKTDTPFTYQIGDTVKGLGIALFAGGLVTASAEIVTNILARDFDAISQVNFYLPLAGAVVMGFSYVFNYGCKLQQESDETL